MMSQKLRDLQMINALIHQGNRRSMKQIIENILGKNQLNYEA